jgi:hypothetical protein
VLQAQLFLRRRRDLEMQGGFSLCARPLLDASLRAGIGSKAASSHGGRREGVVRKIMRVSRDDDVMHDRQRNSD